jgi:hypothetical protein
MQKIDKVNYTNQLKESVGLSKDSKKGDVHYFDDGKIQRWYVIEESASKDVLAFADSPEEISAKLSSVTISNKKDLDVVLKYRQANKVQESSDKDRLFYLDTLYGVKEHSLRKTLKENKQVPFLEKSYQEVIAELDAYPTAPAQTPAQSPLPGQQPGTPVNGAMGGNIIGAAGNEMDFILSDLFDDVLSRIKSLRTEVYAEDDQRKLMAHYFYENLYDMREKIIAALKERIQEQMGQPQPAAATQPAAPATATPAPTPQV